MADEVFFAFIALILGLLTRIFLAWTHVPYTVVMLLWGLLLGSANNTFSSRWSYISPAITAYQEIGPELLANLFLPPLLYAGAYVLPRKVLAKCSVHIALLGFVGVLTSTGMAGVAVRYILPYNWGWTQCFLFGSIVAATDPVAAVTLLKEVDAPETIRVTIDGEALVDDGVAAVLTSVFMIFVSGQATSAGGIVKLALRESLGGPALGVGFAACVVCYLRYARPDEVAEAGVMLVSAYSAFYVADVIVHASGILAVVGMGMAVAVMDDLYGRRGRRTKGQAKVGAIWDALEFAFNTLAFVLSGVIIAARCKQGFADVLASVDYGWAVVVWLLLLVIRSINFVIFWPILTHTGHGFSWREGAIGIWSGLRGIVGLILALEVLLMEGSSAAFKAQQFFLLATTLVLTVVVQGSLFPLLLKVVLGRRKGGGEVIAGDGQPTNI